MAVVCCFWFSVSSLWLVLPHLAFFLGFFGLAALPLLDVYKYRRPLAAFPPSLRTLPSLAVILALLCCGQNQHLSSAHPCHPLQGGSLFRLCFLSSGRYGVVQFPFMPWNDP